MDRLRLRRLAPVLLPVRNTMLLFVCGSNTTRSPMAQAIARHELALAGDLVHRTWAARSAGLQAQPGSPIAKPAAEALRELGVPVPPHRSRPLTAKLCRRSIVIYCMTRAQRAAIADLAPDAADRIVCLDPGGDILEPDLSHQDLVRLGRRMRTRIRSRLAEQMAAAGLPTAAFVSYPIGGA